MSNETVDVMVEGGKASAGATMGQAFGPLGVDIQSILQQINQKTSAFQGMKVPVAVTVDTETKDIVEITVGTPPASELVKKEINLKKGSSYPHVEKVDNLAIEQVIKIAKMKQDSLLDSNLKSAVKTIVGGLGSMGILIEGKEPLEINPEIDSGKYDDLINQEKTEMPQEKRDQLKQQLNEVKQRLIAERGMPVKKEEKKEAPKEEPKEEPKK
tara:strand:+ start:1936 stop:2574 length:639 start_codon:yes stop_codon:yes gene_type:complete